MKRWVSGLLMAAGCGGSASVADTLDATVPDAESSADVGDAAGEPDTGDQDPDVTPPVDTTEDGGGDGSTSSDTPGTEDAGDTPPLWPAATLDVGAAATSLSMTGTRVAWEDAGAIWLYDEAGGARIVLSVTEGVVSGPVLAGEERIVYSVTDDENTDIYLLDIVSGNSSPLVQGEGDQHAPSADGGFVSWVDGHGAAAEIWALDIAPAGGTGEARRLTYDDVEQAHPHAHGRRVVFTDFTNDPDKQALLNPDSLSNPNSDNGDIIAVDVPETGPLSDRIVVTDDAGKQARPASDGSRVVWLDWRGISPEPKFKYFKVFAREIGQPEVQLGSSGWSRPRLWQRPAVLGDRFAWVVEKDTGPAVVMVGSLEGLAQPVDLSAGELVAVALSDGGVGYLGGGRLGIQPLPPQ